MEALPTYLAGLLALLLFTSFVKLLTALEVVRFGMGLRGGALGLVTVALSLALTLLIIQPQLQELGGVDGLLTGKISADQLSAKMLPFMRDHSDPQLIKRFADFAQRSAAKSPSSGSAPASDQSLAVVAAAFTVSEVRQAFTVAFLVLIPFVIIDLLVANVLTALAITSLPAVAVAIPLKILLFIAVDGWRLLSEKLIGSYV